jgi:hypothetical protein
MHPLVKESITHLAAQIRAAEERQDEFISVKPMHAQRLLTFLETEHGELVNALQTTLGKLWRASRHICTEEQFEREFEDVKAILAKAKG